MHKVTKKLVLALGLAVSASAVNAADLRVGLIYPTSGPLAGLGAMYQSGVDFVLNRYNEAGGFHGNKVVGVVYDDAGNTTGAADRFQQAIGEGVRLFATGSTSPVSAQIINDIKNWNDRNPNDKATLLIMGAEGKDFTGKLCDYYTFKMSTTAGIRFKALAEALKANGALGDTVASLQPNYTLGFEMGEAVKEGAETYGYTLGGEIGHDYARVHDFAPYIERLRPMGADTIFTASSVADLRLIVQGAADAALPGKFATLYLDEPGNIGAAGEAALGSYVAQLFNPEATETSEAYREEFLAATGVEPVNVVNNALISMTALTAALNTMPEGDFTADAFVTAMEGLKAEWPMGELTMRTEDHQLLLPVVVAEVSQDVKVTVDDTDLGFKPVSVLTGEQATVPPSPECKMVRP